MLYPNISQKYYGFWLFKVALVFSKSGRITKANISWPKAIPIMFLIYQLYCHVGLCMCVCCGG